MLSVYYAKTTPLWDDAVYERGLSLLSAARLEKQKRIKKAEDRLCGMAAGLLLRYGLKKAGVFREEEVYGKNTDGKPYLLTHPDLYFNLSHSGEYAALAIGDKEVGVDIEKLRTGKQNLANRFFSEEERKVLKAAWSDEAFTRIWTRKESYIKAVGMGMRMPLQSFSTIDNEVNAYHLASFPLEKQYWLSVCQKEEPVQVVPQELSLEDMIEG